MLRVLLIRPPTAGLDVAAYARSIEALPGVQFSDRITAADDRLPSVFRTAGELLTRRVDCDILVTAGPNALLAAATGWRGPIIHVPIGRLTRLELVIGRRLARRHSFRLITSSPALARQATHAIADARRIRVIRPAPVPPRMTRQEARARLGVAEDQPLITVTGVARPGSNHRLAIWAANILVFRDPAVRLFLRPGGVRDGFVQRFVSSAEMWLAVVSDPSLNEAEEAAAADVAICVADGAPDVSPLAAMRHAGTPIVGLRSTWLRERLDTYPATLVAESRARAVARAALEALERGRLPAETVSAEPDGAWAEVLESLVGRG